jgi:putative transposase
MPHEKRQFENGEIYHITIRRIGNELLFGDEQDYFRGIFSIYEFNNANPVIIRDRRKARAQFKLRLQLLQGGRGQTSVKNTEVCPLYLEMDQRDRLVEILAFCLMPNHIHLLVRQLVDNGISKFMQKCGSGYAVYFKEKYQIKLKGHFFQDRFNAVHIETDEQLRVVFVYIHTNPLALIEPSWKEKGIANPKRAIEFLENEYRWSSYFDYLGKKNFPSIIEAEKSFLAEVMGGAKGCQQAVRDWVQHKGEIAKLSKKFFNLSLE